MDKRISIDPKVCHGQASIKGARIPVHQIIRMMANGDTIEELLEEYPSISRNDILACLNYAASLAEEQAVREFTFLRFSKSSVLINQCLNFYNFAFSDSLGRINTH